jgi:hypothetical protein
MTLKLNSDAVKNFNKKADELLLQLAPHPSPPRRRNKIPAVPEIHVSATFTEENIIGELLTNRFVADQNGDVVGRFFEHNDGFVGLFGEGYKNFLRLSEGMQKAKELRHTVSNQLLTDLIFSWLQGKIVNQISSPMTEFVLTECEKQIQEMELWLPIAWLQIQSEISVGKITFKMVTREMLDTWQARVPPPSSPEEEAAMNQHFEQERHELQGYAAATIKLLAEPQKASDIAFEEAENAISLLRFFSPANFSPRRVSYCTLSGKEHLEGETYLIVREGAIESISSSATETSEPSWRLSGSMIANIRGEGLDLLGELLSKEKRTDFQNDVLNSILLYSKSSLAKNYADKLVYILVALESLLLRDSNEPIGTSLRERMAVLISQTIDGRLSVIKNVKDTYGLRSSFIHHGKSIGIDELETLLTFMRNAWVCLHVILTKNANHFSTKIEFIDAVERFKLSGGITE